MMLEVYKPFIRADQPPPEKDARYTSPIISIIKGGDFHARAVDQGAGLFTHGECVSKKAQGLDSSKPESNAKQKAQIVLELRQQYPISGVLKVAGLARSTFDYHKKVLQAVDKHAMLKTKILTIFAHHKGRYGYRRITGTL